MLPPKFVRSAMAEAIEQSYLKYLLCQQWPEETASDHPNYNKNSNSDYKISVLSCYHVHVVRTQSVYSRTI